MLNEFMNSPAAILVLMAVMAVLGIPFTVWLWKVVMPKDEQ